MRKRVLLVDDDFAVLAGLAGALVSEGYSVVHAADADEAIEKFREDRSFDIVLLDLNMPKKSGWDAFEQITAIDPFISIIVITARPDQYATAVAAGVGALIEKPLDLPFLLEKMEDLIRESAQERLARVSGRDPNLSYCPAPNKVDGEVFGQVIDPAKTRRRPHNRPPTSESPRPPKEPLDRMLKAWTGCSESERQFFLEGMKRPAARSGKSATCDPVSPNLKPALEFDPSAGKTAGPRIVEADFFLLGDEGWEKNSSSSRNQAPEKSDEFKAHLPPSAS
jgi:CheY-like chemotaxis protein